MVYMVLNLGPGKFLESRAMHVVQEFFWKSIFDPDSK